MRDIYAYHMQGLISLAVLRIFYDSHGNCLVESAGAAAPGIQQQCFPNVCFSILVGMTVYNQIKHTQILGKIFLFMGHEDAEISQSEIKRQRQVLCPLFIIVAPDNI